jgi:hypothetical protein
MLIICSSRAAGKVKVAKAGSNRSEQQQNSWSSWRNKINYYWLTPIQRYSSNKTAGEIRVIPITKPSSTENWLK